MHACDDALPILLSAMGGSLIVPERRIIRS